MTKHDIIADIRSRNRTATEEFLATFTEEDLLAYLSHLREVVPICSSETHLRSSARHVPTSPLRTVHAPTFTSYKPYMGRPTHAATTSCAKRRRNHVQLG